MAQRRRRKKKKKIFGKTVLAVVLAVCAVIIAIFAVNALQTDRMDADDETQNPSEDLLGEVENEVSSITLSDYTSMEFETAVRDLEATGLVVSISEEENTDVSEGLVIRQLPSAGASVKKGDRVRIFVSSGSAKFELDDYVGVAVGDVKSELTALGVRVVVIEEHSDIEKTGNVFYQEPSAGTTMREGDDVTLYVSMGAGTVLVPSIVGLSESQAEEKLNATGLHLGDIETVKSKESAGVVVKQSIAPNTEVELDTVVDVTVSDGSLAVSE